jgi:hypothetical protein
MSGRSLVSTPSTWAAVLLALCLVLIGRGCAQGSAFEARIVYADSIKDVALDSLASARERAESLQAQAVANADSLAVLNDTLAAVTERATTEIEDADRDAAVAESSFASRSDSLRFRLRTAGDTVGVRLLDHIVVDHDAKAAADSRARDALEGENRTLRVTLAATAENAALWRTTAEGHRHTAEVAEHALAASEAASSARDDALRAKERRVWYERGAALAVVALVVLK